MTRSRTLRLAGGLGVTIVLLGVLGFLAGTRTREADTQQRLVSHAYQVKAVLSALRSELNALEIDHARRAFGGADTTRLAEPPAVSRLGFLLHQLRAATADNPAQQIRIIRIGRLIRRRHGELDSALRAGVGRDLEARAALLTDTALVDSIGAVANAMRSEEDSLLAVRSVAGRTATDLALLVLVALTLTGCMAVGIGTAELVRENRRARTALAALAESEYRYRSLVTDVQDVIFQADADCRWVLLNPAWERITGFRVDETIGRSCLEHIHPGDSEPFARRFVDAAAGGDETFTQPLRLLARDGGVRWLQLHARVHHEPNGKLGNIAGTLTDITSRVYVEERQRRDDERMRQVIEDIPVAVAMFDRDMRYLFASRQWRAKYGLQETAIEGRVHYELVPDVSDVTRAVHRRAMAGAIVRREEERVPRPDGSEDWFRWEVRPWYEQAGLLGGIIVTTERITERKRAEQERLALLEEQSTRALLQANEERYRTLAEALPQIVFTARPDGWVDYFNDNWYAYTGLTQEQSVGWGWAAALHPDDVQRSVDHWTASFTTGVDHDMEYRFRRASDEAYRWHLGRAVPVRDADGHVVKWIGTCTDIDDQKRAENALRQVREQLQSLVAVRTNELSRAVTDLQSEIAVRTHIEAALRDAKNAAEAANRAKSDFLARMSHELRTPLNSVIGFANLLLTKRRAALGAKDAEYVQRIASNGTHLLGVINDILDLSKIEAGRGALSLSTVDLEALVTGTLAQLDGHLHGRDVMLVASVPPHLLPIDTDEQRLRQVLINLVGNALKFTEHGTVTVAVHADPATRRPIRIDVIDTGIGIPPDRQAAIFEAFEQADIGTARRYGGTGLGLAISRALCELLEYRLELHSEPGAGSTFSIVLGSPAPAGALPSLPGAGTVAAGSHTAAA